LTARSPTHPGDDGGSVRVAYVDDALGLIEEVPADVALGDRRMVVGEPEDAARFLNPSLDQLHDPMALADMRVANLLVDGDTLSVIDFDDCGFSWFLYDCATTVSFFEESPEVPALIEAWVRGYRRVGTLSAEDEAEIDTFVMLRRLLLVAWIGSHSETELAQSMGVAYTQTTLPLCERYLSRFGEARRQR